MESQRLVSQCNEPELHFLVHHFAEQMHVKAPTTILLNDDDALIYSTRAPAVLVISEGSLHHLSDEEFARRILREMVSLGANRLSPAVH